MPEGCIAVADAMGITDAGIFGDILGIVPMLSVAGGITLLAGVIALVKLPNEFCQPKPVIR